MSRWLNIVIQILSAAGGLYVSYKTGSLTPTIITSTVQGVVSIVSHGYNPDGTPAQVPYDPPK